MANTVSRLFLLLRHSRASTTSLVFPVKSVYAEAAHTFGMRRKLNVHLKFSNCQLVVTAGRARSRRCSWSSEMILFKIPLDAISGLRRIKLYCWRQHNSEANEVRGPGV